jgi:hypothetical protein
MAQPTKKVQKNDMFICIRKLISTLNLKVRDNKKARPIMREWRTVTKCVPKKSVLRKARANQYCTYCSKKGHKAYYCPATPNTDDKSHTQEERKYATNLLAMPRRATPETIETWLEEGNKLNADNPWNTQQDSRQSHINRLRGQLGFWKAAGASRNVLSWLANGAQAKFERRPPRKAFKNTPSYHDHVDFVHNEVLTHLQDGSLEPVTERYAKCINPIKVEEGKKLRMCIDTRYHPNRFLAAPSFRNEMIETVLSSVIRDGDFMITTDISKAYYAVPLTRREGETLLLLRARRNHTCAEDDCLRHERSPILFQQDHESRYRTLENNGNKNVLIF